jgi:hypothetical protein
MFQPMGMQQYNVAMLGFEKQLITKESKCTFLLNETSFCQNSQDNHLITT